MIVTRRLMQERILYAEELLGIELLPLDQMTDNINPKNVSGFNYETMEYNCYHCNRPTSGFVVSRHKDSDVKWLICLNCKHGSVYDGGVVYPQPLLGQSVEGLPSIIQTVYDEARKSLSSQAYTAC